MATTSLARTSAASNTGIAKPAVETALNSVHAMMPTSAPKAATPAKPTVRAAQPPVAKPAPARAAAGDDWQEF